MDSNTTPASNDAFDQALKEKVLGLRAQATSGIGWFNLVAALSLINTAFDFLNVSIGFMAGLGITQMFDALGRTFSEIADGSTFATVLRYGFLAINVLIAIAFFLAARFSVRYVWLGIVFCVLYALDAVLLLVIQDWVPAAFHGLALFMIGRGLKAASELNKLMRAAG
jgi:hypothetical protein